VHRAPDRRLTLSRNETPVRTSPRFTLALASSAVAVAALTAGTVAAGALTAGPVTAGHVAAGAGATRLAAAPAYPASPAGVLTGDGPGSGTHGTVALDAFAQPLRSADAATARKLSPRQIAWSLLKSHHWSTSEWKYLVWLWIRESGWNPYASNPYSGAYGIPQALPGSKMASAGPNWRTNARTQILWGMHYIKVRYGTPYHAWRHELVYGWY
jgi:resuscitation-promoting factor RpfB